MSDSLPIKRVEAYQAEDGRFFENAADCLRYELTQLLSRDQDEMGMVKVETVVARMVSPERRLRTITLLKAFV